MKGPFKFVSTVFGELCVTVVGITEMQSWLVLSWDMVDKVNDCLFLSLFNEIGLILYTAEVTAEINSRFGAGSGPVLLSSLSCSSSDTSLLECRSVVPTPSCDHSDDAGVVCEGMP